MKPFKVIIMFSLLLLLCGCATTRSSTILIKLNLGMSKQEVIKTIGEPDVARGSIRNKYDQLIEVWQYSLLEPKYNYLTTDFWLYFYDNRLVQWGQAGDWGREADKIYEYRFR